VLLFDLGGVLIDCADFKKLLEWESWTKKLSELEEKSMESGTSERYSRGAIGTKEFVETTISELDLTVSVSRFLREFRLLPKGFYPGADVLLKELSRNYITACLSNTNELHWNKLCGVNKLEKYFKFNFPSHLIHKVKPQKGAFTYVVKALSVEPGAIAFFDDRDDNVAAAKEVGIDAYKTAGITELCDCIRELGIL
jgi:glucose-1-phosphatase